MTIDRIAIAEQLADFRVNVLAKVVPPGPRKAVDHCAACGGPAAHLVGRHTRKTFVVPADCGHHPYPVGEPERQTYHPSDAAVEIVGALISMDKKERAVACQGSTAEPQTPLPVKRIRTRLKIGPRQLQTV